MAAFSSTQQQLHHPFLLDSVFLQNSPSTIDNNNNNNMCCLLLHQPNNGTSPLHNLDQITNNEANFALSNFTDKNSMDSSSIVTDKFDSSSEQVTQKLLFPMDKKRKCKHAASPNSAQSKDKREVKGKKQKKIKDGEEKKSAEEAPTGYIHVRARRGQATDSHSLAERVRRERISERMKLLQALVPGCDKVTGKALMLDEIINYVQSLQNQVEFLSMKLASVNPMFYDFGMDLESFMVRPDQDLSNLASPLLSMQGCSPTTASNYHFLENSANSILFQQAQIPNVLPLQPQGSRHTLWEVEEHRQKIINQSGFSNTLFSFH